MTQKKGPIIGVRPRRGSALEAFQKKANNKMSDTLHSWAESFKHNLEQSEKEGEQ